MISRLQPSSVVLRRLWKSIRATPRAFRGDVQAQHLLGEMANHVLNRSHFYGETGKEWFALSRDLYVGSDFDAHDLRRRWDRLWVVYESARMVDVLDGDMVEFGVYKGASGLAMCRGSANGTYWGFDSFQGLPRPRSSIDGNYWSEGDLRAQMDEAESNLKVFQERVRLCPGWIPESFAEHGFPARVKLAHIDVDLFEPTKAALSEVGPRMVVGGLIICDDFGFNSCPGARKACEEFLAERGERRAIHLPTGQLLIFC